MSGSAEVIRNMWSWAALKRAGIEGVSRVAAANAQNYSRTHYRWHPQTGRAHGGLNGGMYWESIAALKIYLAHSMSYGVFLEMSNDRKNAILEEAINSVKDSWFNGVKRIMES